MFDIGSSELLLIVIVAVVVIGPKDLPRALYKVGQVVGKARGMARHFRSGIDAMIREAELEDLERKWAEENRRIMAEHPATPALEAGPEAATGLTEEVARPLTPSDYDGSSPAASVATEADAAPSAASAPAGEAHAVPGAEKGGAAA